MPLLPDSVGKKESLKYRAHLEQILTLVSLVEDDAFVSLVEDDAFVSLVEDDEKTDFIRCRGHPQRAAREECARYGQ